MSSSKTAKGGGSKYEKEDIELIKLTIPDVKKLLEENHIRDAKTIIGLMWFLNKQ